MEGSLNNGMCRCCASEGTFKDVSSKYTWMGEEEIYSDMLRECFDITLANAEDEHNGICEVCITQLRNAANFKKQVQLTEEQFKKRLHDDMFKSNIIKLEVNALEEDRDGNNSDNNLSDDYSDYEVPIKTEDEPKGKKRGKAASSRAKKPKTEAESSKSNRWDSSNVDVSKLLSNLLDVKPKVEGDSDWSISIKNGKNRPLRQPSQQRRQITLSGVSAKVLPENVKTLTGSIPGIKLSKMKDLIIKRTGKKYMPVMQKHLLNIRQILLCTNATPIRAFDGIGYCCGYCSDQCPTPAELKQHTLTEHDDGTKKYFMRNESLTSFMVKLDITDFKCTLCDGALGNLEDAIKHLKAVHDKLYYSEIDNHILSFKFNSEGVVCSVCSKLYLSFKLAIEHMRVHYTNYICDICNAPFINRRTLKSHQSRHKQGDFACSFCEKIFDTSQKKNEHEKLVHKRLEVKRNKCPQCGEKFAHYKQKLNHMVEVHGAKPLELKCMACDLVFNSRNALTKHTRRDHLMERSHECQQCDKKFFSLKCLKDHMLKHSGLREYKCEVCFKAYGRKNTLREHLRIHADDRRFKCEFCDQAFVQKCSLKGHLRSKHGEILQF